MFLGPMFLLFVAVRVSAVRETFSWQDMLYFAVLGGILAARCLEYYAGHPQTATGEPATKQDLWRWAILTSALGIAVWLGAVAWRMI